MCSAVVSVSNQFFELLGVWDTRQRTVALVVLQAVVTLLRLFAGASSPWN